MLGILYASWIRGLVSYSRDTGLIPGFARSPTEVNGNTLQYSCLGNSMDRGAWPAIVDAVSKSLTKLSIHTHTINWGKLFSLSCFKDFFCSFLCFFYFFFPIVNVLSLLELSHGWMLFSFKFCSLRFSVL